MWDEPDREWRFGFFPAFMLVLLRGVLLWLLILLAGLVWLIGWPVWKRRNVPASQLIGWADLNLVASLQRSLFRPFVKNPAAFVPIRQVSEVTHRVLWNEPA